MNETLLRCLVSRHICSSVTTSAGNVPTRVDDRKLLLGVPPAQAQSFAFNTKGLLLAQLDAKTTPSTLGAHYFLMRAAFTIGPGTYKATFLIRDCANTKTVVPDFVPVTVNTP